ncbi:hypothetical protein DPMN_058980 [Dreissena polymorpha]|uniref:Uncharacterized protein n=1 Tax=Dreissena polymorpha TaxID=45954 RepID=A0A9D4C2Q8_DREPO|nr:hypothetical protein DPMN_058980 [Dreissena polymorpha]
MPVAFRQSAYFLILVYRSYTGTLTAFIGALPGSVWVPVEVRCRPGSSRCRPGCSRCRAGCCDILILSRWSPGFPRFIPVVLDGAPVHPGRVPVHPGRSRITQRGYAGTIVRLGLYPDKERCTDCVRCLT